MNKDELVQYWKKNYDFSKELIAAFKKIPREDFMIEEYKKFAYVDHAFPLIEGQTISQPTTVMIMINELKLKKTDKVLEIGTGSGYNAALMSRLCKMVISTEVKERLICYAKEKLKKLNIDNVKIFLTKKELGYKKLAPYDKIIVTCASEDIPEELVAQLKIGGIMIIPVGNRYSQKMVVIKKFKKNLKIKEIGDFVFVPMIRE